MRSRSSTRRPTPACPYRDLWRDALPRWRSSSTTHGVQPGDVVSVQLPNWYETVAIDLGVLARGAVLNPLLPNYRSRELHHILGTSRASVLFTPGEFRGFDHAALGRELHQSLDSLRAHVVVRDDGDFWAGWRAVGVPSHGGWPRTGAGDRSRLRCPR